MKYTIIETESGEILQRIDEDGKVWSIPMDEANSDYQAYLKRDEAPVI
jgi:hypothetical protein